MKYKILRITNDTEYHPEAREDTERYPELVLRMETENQEEENKFRDIELFVISEKGDVFLAEEFFKVSGIDSFEVNPEVIYPDINNIKIDRVYKIY